MVRLFFICLIITVISLAAETKAASLTVYGAGGDFHVPVKSLTDMKFRRVIKQEYDFSCGSAALATLLTHHYGVPVAEKDVLQMMYENGDQTKIKKEGFSMLDMKKYLISIGLKAEGYRESLDKLSTVKIPAIVLINNNGYMHFVVVKGITGDTVLVGDPAAGLRTVNRKEFEKMWNGILFVVHDQMEVARQSFNQPEDWRKLQRPLSEYALDRQSLAGFAVDISLTPNYY